MEEGKLKDSNLEEGKLEEVKLKESYAQKR